MCQEALCKSCAQFVDGDRFSWLPQIPKELSHTTYCGPCFNVNVAPAMAEYDEAMEQAKRINVFFTTDSKQTRFFNRKEKPFKIANCPDKEETLLRLAFLAVRAGFNSIIDVEITSEKVRNGSYQTTIWKGTGVPTKLEGRRFQD